MWQVCFIDAGFLVSVDRAERFELGERILTGGADDIEILVNALSTGRPTIQSTAQAQRLCCHEKTLEFAGRQLVFDGVEFAR